ncbi:flavin monoamine oxidase family protein [Halomarina litorea]|uniref:flavin monoamine oxidase family protein n=1 Tax=Halomarina litorea TaxID=2961595 RepID=UPI0020C2E0DA|nr:FAD-dependent oxidoreductase [Halomarina sp. BCD28]
MSDVDAAADRETDVVVVGAGLAGLTAARWLDGRDVDVRVLDARPQVGGRLRSREVDGVVVDLGTQWVGPGQRHLRRLAADLGCEQVRQRAEGDALRYDGNGTHRGKTAIDSLPLPARLNLGAAVRLLDRRSGEVPLEAPHRAPDATAWDETTLATWRDGALRTRRARALFDAAVRSSFGSEPADLSYLSVLFAVRAAGGFERLTGLDGRPRTRIAGGVQTLADRMAADLSGRVHTDSPVRAIAHDEDGVVVRTDDESVAARHVVVATAASRVACLDFDPHLPARRAALSRRPPHGAVVTCVATYEVPFWRPDLSGDVLDEEGPVCRTRDVSPLDGERGVLVGQLFGNAARRWSERTRSERRSMVLDRFAEYFGDRAVEATGYTDVAWPNVPWSGGCCGAAFPPGILTTVGEALREPVGRVHWAGAETATRWPGHMDGGVQAGKRAAAELVGRLRTD